MAPTNGFVALSGTVNLGDTATFWCDRGYTLTGVATSRCIGLTGGIGGSPAGTSGWSAAAPTCVGEWMCASGREALCVGLCVVVVFVLLLWTMLAVVVADRSCRALVSYSVLRLAAVTCGGLAAPTDGAVTDATIPGALGATRTFSCANGFHLWGVAVLTCRGVHGGDSTTATGTADWSSPAPTCVGTCRASASARCGRGSVALLLC